MFLTIILIILASLAVYIPVGILCARSDVPRSVAAHTTEKGGRYWDGEMYQYPEGPYIERDEVRVDMGLMVLLWPFLFPQRKFFNSIEKQIDKIDPKVITQKQKEAAELEKAQRSRTKALEKENDELERRNRIMWESRMEEIPQIRDLELR